MVDAAKSGFRIDYDNEELIEEPVTEILHLSTPREDENVDIGTAVSTPEYSIEHKWLLFFSSVYIFTFAGAFWGWGPLQLLLEENGAFHSLCGEIDDAANNRQNICPEQSARLITVQMMGQLMLITSPILGAIADKFSSKVLMYTIAVTGILGLSILAISIATHIDELLFVAFICLGIMSVGSSVMTVQTGMVFKGRMRTRVISGLNALYDAGSITYLGLYHAKKWLNVSFTAIVVAYLIFSFISFGGAAYFWMKLERDADSIAVQDDEVEHGRSATCDALPNEEKIDADINIASSDDEITPISVMPTNQHLCSKLFITLLFYFSFYQSRNVFTLTTARNFLGILGDNEMDFRYLTIFTLLMPASLLALPFVDVILGKYGFHAGLQTVNILALIHGLIQVCSNDLNIQIIGFVAFTFFRCFLYSVAFSFMASFLRPNASGLGAGFMNLAGGVCIICNIPMANAAVLYLDSFFLPNLIYTIGIAPLFFTAHLMGKWSKEVVRKESY